MKKNSKFYSVENVGDARISEVQDFREICYFQGKMNFDSF